MFFRAARSNRRDPRESRRTAARGSPFHRTRPRGRNPLDRPEQIFDRRDVGRAVIHRRNVAFLPDRNEFLHPELPLLRDLIQEEQHRCLRIDRSLEFLSRFHLDSRTPQLRTMWSYGNRCDFWTMTSVFHPREIRDSLNALGSSPVSMAAVPSVRPAAAPDGTIAAWRPASSQSAVPTASCSSSRRTNLSLIDRIASTTSAASGKRS